MNKAKRVFITFLAALMLLVAIPFNASATDTAQLIFDFLVDEMGLNSAAACGVLANIECESDFNYTLYGDSGSSYGICQWHAERFTNLKNYCGSKGLDWKSLEGQLWFLNYELTNNKSDTGYIIDKLKNVPDTAEGAYEAGYDWCYYFERPSNRTAKAENRGNNAKNVYWPKYHRTDKTETSTTTTYTVGDINADKKVNSADALVALKVSVGSKSLDNAQKKRADINGDTKVNSADALIMLKISVGADSLNNYK